MKYVITGGAGNISKPIVEGLLAKNHTVTAVSRNEKNIASLVSAGAKAAIGSVEDLGFVTNTFNGADAVYLIIPPNFAATDWFAYQQKVADNYVAAIVNAGVQKVVVLSSIGAHMGKGAGPVDALGYLERKLEALDNVNALFLRPSYFMYNLLNMIPLIKNMDIMGSNFGNTEEKLALVHTKDIAAVAVEELNTLGFTGKSVRYIVGDEKHPSEIAALLSEAIGKPGIPWVPFTDEQSLQGMLGAGLAATFAEGYTTMGAAIRSGEMQRHYYNNKPATLAPTKLTDFLPEFIAAYNQ
jgi:uncharacterized protein YbjT (DUF2867 family)